MNQQIDEGSHNIPMIALPVDSEIAGQQLLQAIPILQAMGLHHFLHRDPEIQERISRLHRHDCGAFLVRKVVVRFFGFFQDGTRVSWLEEQPLGPHPSNHRRLVVGLLAYLRCGGETVFAVANLERGAGAVI